MCLLVCVSTILGYVESTESKDNLLFKMLWIQIYVVHCCHLLLLLLLLLMSLILLFS